MKIGNFGSAKQVESKDELLISKIYSNPPELEDGFVYGLGVDWWNIGQILLSLLHLENTSKRDERNQSKTGYLEEERKCREEIKSLLDILLEEDPKIRNIENIKKHLKEVNQEHLLLRQLKDYPQVWSKEELACMKQELMQADEPDIQLTEYTPAMRSFLKQEQSKFDQVVQQGN